MIELTKSQKIDLTTTEIAKRIRAELKDFKGCKFSVTSEYYSGGSGITITLLESKRKVIKPIEELTESTYWDYAQRNYTKEQLIKMQEGPYWQLNKFQLRKPYNPEVWCNGVFLTEEGHNLLKQVVLISDQYNFDESDSQTDYYSVNFSLSINIGKWNVPYKQVKEE